MAALSLHSGAPGKVVRKLGERLPLVFGRPLPAGPDLLGAEPVVFRLRPFLLGAEPFLFSAQPLLLGALPSVVLLGPLLFVASVVGLGLEPERLPGVERVLVTPVVAFLFILVILARLRRPGLQRAGLTVRTRFTLYFSFLRWYKLFFSPAMAGLPVLILVWR